MKKLALVFFVFVVVFGCSQTDKAQVIELGIPTLANDVATGSLLYEEKTVKIRGIVAFGTSKYRKLIAIKVPVHNVYLNINPDESKKQDLSQYKEGVAYTFTVYISEIRVSFSDISGINRTINCTLVE